MHELIASVKAITVNSTIHSTCFSLKYQQKSISQSGIELLNLSFQNAK